MRAAGLVKAQVSTSAGAGFWDAGLCLQVDLLVFDAAPKALDVDVAAPSDFKCRAVLLALSFCHDLFLACGILPSLRGKSIYPIAPFSRAAFR